MPWPTINPGILRHKVQIQVQTQDRDSFGQPLNVWTTILTLPAEVRTSTGKELFQTGQFTAQVSHTITVRWQPQLIAPGMRALFTDNAGASPPTYHVYKIQWVDNVEQRNVLLKIYCLELNSPE